MERRKICESCAKLDVVDEVVRFTTRTRVTFTMLVAVAVVTDGLVPVVGTELSVTVAVSVCVPDVVGNHTIEKGEVPPTVPMLTPLSKNCTDTMPAPAVGVAFAVIVNPAGESILGIVEPDDGDVIVIDGVANAPVAATSAIIKA